MVSKTWCGSFRNQANSRIFKSMYLRMDKKKDYKKQALKNLKS